MTYVDGFVVAVPASNKEAYRKHASDAVPMFKQFGAGRFVEAWGDDVPEGKVTDFRRAVKANEDENVVFSFIEYPSREARDAAKEKMMADPAMKEMGENMPFDGKRMIYGGFKTLFEVGSGAGTGYIDGMLAAVPAGTEDSYRDFAAKSAAIFKEHGATRLVDAWQDDVPDGKITDFKGAVQAQADEKVVFSWVEWPSKEVRDAGWQALQADERMQSMEMPFDGKRMVYGGFAPIVDK